VNKRQTQTNATVVVCTYSSARWELLVDAVGSVLGQLIDGDDLVVVIDHNPELLVRVQAAFGDRPSVQVLANRAERGISGARNTAVSVSRGEIVAFLDDDAIAGPDWLSRIREALTSPQVLGVGTAAVALWPDRQRPSWFPPEFDWVVGCTYEGLPKRPAPVRNVIGASMAFRREAFGQVGGFSTVVGRVGAVPTGCEETELCIRIRQSSPGSTILFLPDVSVQHRVARERVATGYFLRRCIGEGRSKAWVTQLVGAGDGLSSERDYVASVLPRGLARELRRALRGRLSGYAAAALIVAGLAATACSYLVCRAVRLRPFGRPDAAVPA
jgi:GT2 family glycosyltransferase